MTILCAVPYDTSAPSFFFKSLEEYESKYAAQLPVEEYEIQYVDGDNFSLFNTAQICQGNLNTWFESLDEIDTSSDQGISVRYLLSIGYSITDSIERADDVQLFHGTAESYAQELYEEMDIPESLVSYIDYERIARDLELSGDITEFGYKLFITNANDF
jgi:hypothetical protein